MADASVVAIVKTDLRISHSQLDTDISLNIDSCLLDLKLAGVNNRDVTDAIIKKAIILYCRANIGFSKDSEKFQMAYNRLKDALALSGDYNTEPEQEEQELEQEEGAGSE